MTQPINAVDNQGYLAVPTENYIKVGGLYVPVSATNPLPTLSAGSSQSSTVLQNAAQATGNGVALNVSNVATVGFEITGTFVGTVTFEVSNDQNNWYPILVSQSGTSTIGNTATATGIYYAEVVSVTYVRARISAYTSGSITVTAVADAEARPSKSVNALIVGSLANVVGTPGSALPSQAILEGISDGANIQARLGNTQGTLLASAARTASTFTATQVNYNARGVLISLNVTAASGTGGLQVVVCGIDPVTGMTINTNSVPTAVTATGEYSYLIYPGTSGGRITQVTSLVLPRTWNAMVAANDSSSYTYSLGYSLIL